MPPTPSCSPPARGRPRRSGCVAPSSRSLPPPWRRWPSSMVSLTDGPAGCFEAIVGLRMRRGALMFGRNLLLILPAFAFAAQGCGDGAAGNRGTGGAGGAAGHVGTGGHATGGQGGSASGGAGGAATGGAGGAASGGTGGAASGGTGGAGAAGGQAGGGQGGAGNNGGASGQGGSSGASGGAGQAGSSGTVDGGPDG